MGRASGRGVTELRADGGAAVMDGMLQLVADQLQVPVSRPVVQETTALGAAYLAGLSVGMWSSVEEVGRQWMLDRQFAPAADAATADGLYAPWQRAVQRSRRWAGP
jgi:glycerol kinase